MNQSEVTVAAEEPNGGLRFVKGCQGFTKRVLRILCILSNGKNKLELTTFRKFGITNRQLGNIQDAERKRL